MKYEISAQRSRNMAKIKAKNTKPEILVRRKLWSFGYRYRLHVKNLPGKPDIYIPRIKTAVFVHGCFWHQHKGCKREFMPKSNIEYWSKKLDNNVKRFKEQKKTIKRLGLHVAVIWECETKKKDFADILLTKLEV